MDKLNHYFKDLTPKQLHQFELLKTHLLDWNTKINLISRKDTADFEVNHLLHALSIAKYIRLSNQKKVLDIGTGGGFPGLPLAIFFPKCNFHLVDSIGKKIKVVQDLIEKLALENVKASHMRVENLNEEYHFIVSRAVAPTKTLLDWTKKCVIKGTTQYLFLKGGDLKDELKAIGYRAKITNLTTMYNEPFFETKKIVHIKS